MIPVPARGGRAISFSGQFMNPRFSIHQLDDVVVVELHLASLMDPTDLDDVSATLHQLIDQPGHKKIVLDFAKVNYLSSPTINIILMTHKALSGTTCGGLVLCQLKPGLLDLLHILRLDHVLHICPTRQEAITFLADKKLA